MSEDLSKHDEIIAEAREKYTVHNCDQCEFRKSCLNKFDSDECKSTRQSIMLGFGVEDGYFTKLLDRLEAAHKHEATCEKSSQVGNNAKMREALETILCFADGNRWIGMMRTVAALAKHGLSAPPRNCDRYPTLAAALDAWRDIDPRVAGPFNEWLFAEAKGGAE